MKYVHFIVVVVFLSCNHGGQTPAATGVGAKPSPIEKTVFDLDSISKDSYDIVLDFEILPKTAQLEISGFVIIPQVYGGNALSSSIAKFENKKPDEAHFGCLTGCDWIQSAAHFDIYDKKIDWKVETSEFPYIVCDTIFRCDSSDFSSDWGCIVCDEHTKFVKYKGSLRVINSGYDGLYLGLNYYGELKEKQKDAYPKVNYTISLHHQFDKDEPLIFEGEFSFSGAKSSKYPIFTTSYAGEKLVNGIRVRPKEHKSDAVRNKYIRMFAQREYLTSIVVILDSWQDVTDLFCIPNGQRPKIKVPKPLGGQMQYEIVW